MTAPISAVVAACCVLLLLPRADASLVRVPAPRPRGTHDLTRRGWPWQAGEAAGLVAALVVWSGGGARLMLVVVGVGAVLSVMRKVVGLWRLRRARQQRRRTTIMLCDALAAELRGGLAAVAAVVRACEGVPDLSAVAATARLGGDIPGALRAAAGGPGAEGLRAVAAAWDVGAGSGAALAGVLDQVAATLRSDEDARAEVAAALGPPRATAKMLAILPLAGIALGESMGAHPVSFLLNTPWGLGCLTTGVVLAMTGVWWVEGLASAAER